MPRVSYTAPATVDESRQGFGERGRFDEGPVRRDRSLSAVEERPGEARSDRRYEAYPGPSSEFARRAAFFVIGAATPGVMISANEKLEHAFPGVVEGVDLIGSTQIQGRASIAGNLCNGSPAADSVPPVIAARGTAIVAGPKGRREVPVEAIVTGPGRTSLEKGEFVVEFRLPKPNRARPAPICASSRAPRWTFAVVGVAVDVTLDAGGTCTDARVVLGAVAPTQLISRRRQRRSSATSSTPRRSPSSTPRRRRPASPSPTSAARSNTAPKSPASWRAGRRQSPSNAPRRAPRVLEERLGEDDMSKHQRNHHDQRRADGVSVRGAADHARRAARRTASDRFRRKAAARAIAAPAPSFSTASWCALA